VEKSNQLYSVLSILNQSGILSECVLVGSWCQDLYRGMYNNPFEIPAATTTDADFFIPKKMKHFEPQVDITSILENNGFSLIFDRSGFIKFKNEYIDVEFHTEPGNKSEENIFEFKNLKLKAGELRFMEIPLRYNFIYKFFDLSIKIPEPEAYTLHKLIISQRRKNQQDKKEKDIEAVRGMFEYFNDKEKHVNRLNEILADFYKGWQNRVYEALKITGLSLPTIKSS